VSGIFFLSLVLGKQHCVMWIPTHILICSIPRRNFLITILFGKCGCQYFISLTLKKKIMDTGVLDFFNKKLILDYYFCFKSGPVFLFQIFIIYWHPHLPFGQHISVSTFVKEKKIRKSKGLLKIEGSMN
jgi:hypothetical protein